MPAGFTDTEKQKIKEGLIKEGRKLFSQYGLKKTTIKDITNAVGIAQGSFIISTLLKKNFILKSWTWKA